MLRPGYQRTRDFLANSLMTQLIGYLVGLAVGLPYTMTNLNMTITVQLNEKINVFHRGLHVRAVINKFVDNLCHFFKNPPMEIMFAHKIVSRICYKLEKYFSYFSKSTRVIVAMATYRCRQCGRSKTFICLQFMQQMYKPTAEF